MTDTKPLPEANQPGGAGNRLLDKVRALSDNPGAAAKFLAQGAAMENAAKSNEPAEETIVFDPLKARPFNRKEEDVLAGIREEMQKPSTLTAEQAEAVRQATGDRTVTVIEGAAGVFVYSDVDDENVKEFYEEAGRVMAEGRARQTAEPIPFELGLPAEMAATPLEMPLTTSEDRDADWVGLPSDSAGLTRFLTASDNDGQGPKGALSWRQMMKDMLQESASEGGQAPAAEEMNALRERRRKCLGLEDNQAPEQSAKLSGTRP